MKNQIGLLGWLSLVAFVLVSLSVRTSDAAFGDDTPPASGIPVILDTDIGGDIDDTWALVLALKSPELDIKLVVGDQGMPQYRAKLIAKLLETAGRTEIPVGVGVNVKRKGKRAQEDWVRDYDLTSYPGKVYQDGVQAIIDTIMKSPHPITLIAIGPMPNLREALRREPRIANKAKFIGMHGSVRVGYRGAKTPAKEYNVAADPKACQKVFTAPWDMTITPLDTCGLVSLDGKRYAAVRDCPYKLVRALIQNYRIWCGPSPGRADKASSTLFDTVAVYLAIDDAFCQMETLPIRVTDDGYTVVDRAAKKIRIASKWKDMNGFQDYLVQRLVGAK